MNKRFTIFLVSYDLKNNPRFKTIIKNIKENTVNDYNLILFNNGDYKECLEELHKIDLEPDLTIISSKNIFCCEATNKVLKNIDTEFAVYICSNDCFIVKKGWDKDTLEFMDQHHKVGFAGDVWELSNKYWNIVDKTLSLSRNNKWYKNKSDFVFNHVQGGFYILRMSMYKEIGGFNENIKQNGMDFEYSYYVQTKGWEIGKLNFVQSCDKHIRKNFYNEGVKIYHPCIPIGD